MFGVGGDDSKIFVGELFGAYERYASSLGLRVEILDSDAGHIMASVKGRGAGRAFRHETGQHCCQRVPQTERSGRKQTSFISVAVLPIRDDVWEPIRESELEITTQCGHGPGGQHQNKTESAVRVKHRATGITVFINGRDQKSNRRDALRIITARVNDKRQSESNAAYAEFRRTRLGSGNRGDKVRTYNFMRSEVADHRLGTKTSNVKAVMKGEFGLILR